MHLNRQIQQLTKIFIQINFSETIFTHQITHTKSHRNKEGVPTPIQPTPLIKKLQIRQQNKFIQKLIHIHSQIITIINKLKKIIFSHTI